MNNAIKITIADRNGNIRSFLRRELEAEGYCITTARDGRELLSCMHSNESPDLLIIDPDLPLIEVWEAAWRKNQCDSPDRVVIYSSLAKTPDFLESCAYTAKIEKGENPEQLKKAVAEAFDT